jgi:hypothetical protein
MQNLFRRPHSFDAKERRNCLPGFAQTFFNFGGGVSKTAGGARTISLPHDELDKPAGHRGAELVLALDALKAIAPIPQIVDNPRSRDVFV